MREISIVEKAGATSGTHAGLKREGNEDRSLIQPLDREILLLAVADGMGGHAGGADAARTVIDTLRSFPVEKMRSAAPEQVLSETLLEANTRILRAREADPQKSSMGSTATVALVRNNHVHWAHVGDSRLYLARKGNLRQLTTDHTFVQELLDHGDITPEQAAMHPFRSMLDQCMGCEECAPEVGNLPLERDDGLLLCSDGLNRELDDESISGILANGDTQCHTVQMLVEAAVMHGGRDNITVVLWQQSDNAKM